jgi:hypothetical protein
LRQHVVTKPWFTLFYPEEWFGRFLRNLGGPSVTLKTEAAGSSEALVLSIKLHTATFQKAVMLIPP